MEMAKNMKKVIKSNHINDFIEVERIDNYKVHDMRFKEQEGTSLPLVDNSNVISAKNE